MLIFLQAPDSQPSVVIALAAIAAIVSIVTAILAYKSQQAASTAAKQAAALAPAIAEVKVTVDGRMEQLSNALEKASNLEGAERERKEARERKESGGAPIT